MDAALLDAVQDEFPVCSSPYAAIAERCGTTPEEAERRISRMRSAGVIRRLGAVVNSRALGMVTTLVAADVEREAVDEVAHHLDGTAEVTHSYLREGRPNLWFTLVAPSQDRIDDVMRSTRALEGVASAVELPATQVFKLRVRVHASDGRRQE